MTEEMNIQAQHQLAVERHNKTEMKFAFNMRYDVCLLEDGNESLFETFPAKMGRGSSVTKRITSTQSHKPNEKNSKTLAGIW